MLFGVHIPLQVDVLVAVQDEGGDAVDGRVQQRRVGLVQEAQLAAQRGRLRGQNETAAAALRRPQAGAQVPEARRDGGVHQPRLHPLRDVNRAQG